jgi:acyl carrier protein phosphodiesterase
MSKTLQIRDVPDETYQRLVQRAAESGITVPELLRREVDKLAGRLTTREWLERTRRMSGPVRESDVVDSLDEARGPWPD